MAPKITVNGRNAGECDDLAVHRTLTVNGMDLYKLLNSGLSQLVPGASAIYLFNEGAGQVLTDYSGNGNHGTLGSTDGDDTNDPAWGPTGLIFDADDYVALAAFPEVKTLSIVFYTGSAIGPASTAQYLLGGNFAADTNGGIALGASTISLDNEIVSVISGAAPNRSSWCDAGGSIAAGWHDLTVTWSGSAWSIYLDGTTMPVTVSGTPKGLTDPASVKLATRGGAAASWFTGGIAVLLAYSTELTATQVAQNRTTIKKIVAARGVTLP